MLRRFAHIVLLILIGFALVPHAGAQQPPDRPGPAAEKKPDDLSKRLLRKAMKQSEEDVMDAILRLMNESRHKVEVEFDPGEQTQALQQDIVEKLDQAIQAAAKNRRRTRQPQSPGSADKRRLARGEKQSDESQAGEQRSGSDAVADAGQGADPAETETPPAEMVDLRRGWGHLPAREREELIQGVAEDYLERYRVWVERYYRALQETEPSRD